MGHLVVCAAKTCFGIVAVAIAISANATVDYLNHHRVPRIVADVVISVSEDLDYLQTRTKYSIHQAQSYNSGRKRHRFPYRRLTSIIASCLRVGHSGFGRPGLAHLPACAVRRLGQRCRRYLVH